MNNFEDNVWNDYYLNKQLKAPRVLLNRAISYSNNNNNINTNILKAYDLGAGIGTDSIILSENNFQVNAVDSNSSLSSHYKSLSEKYPKISFYQEKIGNIIIKDADFINSNLLFPFVKKTLVDKSFTELSKNGLKKGGIFCGNFFGLEDDRKRLNLMPKETIISYFNGWEILFFSELKFKQLSKEKDYFDSHIFEVIARR